jgi:hypothetical protein
MAIPAAELETLIDALRRARLTGTKQVQHGETTLIYKSDQEMAAALADAEAALAEVSGTARRGVSYIYQSRKGL